MQFEIKTLVDVTQTNARKGMDSLKVKQQDNFNTLYNTIGLRTNPTDFSITIEKETLSGLGFGSSYKGKHSVWTVKFFVEAEDSTDCDRMREDFNLIPFISDLENTVKFQKSMFITSPDSDIMNIIFTRIDK